MTPEPLICFGQQPCGFFPKRFLMAKIYTARRLQREVGGEIVFFYHDSDHDPRETRTLLRHRKNGEPFEFNFTFANPIQRKFSPLYLKRVVGEWREKTTLQLYSYLDRPRVELFQSIAASNVADFCLEMYHRMGLLEGIHVSRSSDPEFRRVACKVDDFYVDVPYENEIVRARCADGELKLHKGGDSYLTLPPVTFSAEQVNPTRDTRLPWMQSVLHCTHYVSGASEQDYMRKADAPEIFYVEREFIERQNEAYVDE